ncbi:MAG TPA: hypothetical protein PKO06_12265, partial [Candidatus Ozemobacteraceae bacterium]|nr:hypothetical protein [Candidatus Ozemobacteraceae bacterium]
VQTIQPSDAAIGGVAPALRPHSHGEEEEEGTAGEADDGADDPNVEAGDSRPLVPLAVTVNRAVNLLEEALFGSLVVRSGAATGWKMSCVPVDIDGQSLSVMVVATAKFNNQQRAVRVLIADPFEAAFASRAAVSAGMTDQVGLHFHVGEWFANLGLEALVQAGGGEIVIDEEAHEMHEKLLNNVKASTAYEGETHE